MLPFTCLYTQGQPWHCKEGIGNRSCVLVTFHIEQNRAVIVKAVCLLGWADSAEDVHCTAITPSKL
jgi:hypothetical protein